MAKAKSPKKKAKKKQPASVDPPRYARMTRHDAIAHFGVGIDDERFERQLVVMAEALVAFVTLGAPPDDSCFASARELVWRVPIDNSVSPLVPRWLPAELGDRYGERRGGIALFVRLHDGEPYMFVGRAEPLRWEQDVSPQGDVVRAFVRLGLRALSPKRLEELRARGFPAR